MNSNTIKYESKSLLKPTNDYVFTPSYSKICRFGLTKLATKRDSKDVWTLVQKQPTAILGSKRESEDCLRGTSSNNLPQKLFGDNKDTDILVDLISSVLNREIKSIEILNEKLVPDTIKGKEMVLDIKAKMGDGTKVNIEMQVRNENNMIKRVIAYTFKRYIEEFNRGGKYQDLQKTISINFLDYTLFKGRANYIHMAESMIKADEYDGIEPHGHPYEIYYVELDKFRAGNVDLNLKLHRWLSMINNDINHEELEVIAKMDEKIRKAADKLYQLSESEEERMVAEARAKYWSDYNSEMHSQREEGKEEGREEGREEAMEEVAIKMLSKGIDFETISMFTGLSVEGISRLKKI